MSKARKRGGREDVGGRPSGFQSVARAARLLEMFTVEQPALTLSEITAELGVGKPTAHRYATALRQAGLLRLADGAYTLGPRVVELASAALAGLSVINVAGPHLERLGAETSQTAVLSVWDGEAPVVVRMQDAADGRMVRIVVATGSRLPRESARGSSSPPTSSRTTATRGWRRSAATESPTSRMSSRASPLWRRRSSRGRRSSPRWP